MALLALIAGASLAAAAPARAAERTPLRDKTLVAWVRLDTLNQSGSGTAILVRAGGITEIGPMRADGSGFKAGRRVDREWKFGSDSAPEK